MEILLQQMQGCMYKTRKKSEINILTNKIKRDGELVRKMKNSLPELFKERERTAREVVGMILIKKIEIDCKKNILNLIENMPECV